MKFFVKVTVSNQQGADPIVLEVPHGMILRKALLQNRVSPYRAEKKILNCRGMGICGTCKVLVKEDNQWWEKRSCQIQCFHPIEIQLK